MTVTVKRRRHTPEQVVRELREVEQVEVSEQTYLLVTGVLRRRAARP